MDNSHEIWWHVEHNMRVQECLDRTEEIRKLADPFHLFGVFVQGKYNQFWIDIAGFDLISSAESLDHAIAKLNKAIAKVRATPNFSERHAREVHAEIAARHGKQK